MARKSYRRKSYKKSHKRQRVYKMKGCSNKTRRKSYLGGGDINLAYTGSNNDIKSVPNPFFAYTGKGGSSCNSPLTPSLDVPLNTNGADKTLPNTGPISGTSVNFLNPQGLQRGGCGCGLPAMTGGNPGIPYPDGLVGSKWSSENGLPGVNGIQGDNNYYALNNYNNDISRQMISTGANRPFSVGGKRTKKQRKQGGGSAFLGQDLINLGRQIQFGLGSAYNAVAGYSAPANPLPWKGQLTDSSNINTIRAAAL